ncbi:N-acetyltransferase [Chitinophaga lutea]|uniref:N-acetyltransferase n=1 Tax=Chitinophaga lutea TaxID=2488634 RepID=A0A3N4PXQ6_9BACT|nr:GNAT family N-acetyltransferase [Chitinophaga lutea]RPE09921.1 N-acetyltransferase [Chitinophaga lutea]
MHHAFDIRPLNNGYTARIIDLILPIQQVEHSIPVTLADQPDLLDIEGFYQQGGGQFWGAVQGEQLIGSIALIAIGHQAGAIRKMFVKKEFRGKELSIAQQLLDRLIAYCREQGIHDLFLGTVEVLKAAQRFYERNGFHRIEKADLPDYFPRMPADTLFFHLHIPAA